MEQALEDFMGGLSLPLLFLIAAAMIYVLSRGADLLVEQAAALSRAWGVPPVLIGATIVSLGTTLPETAVSVFAALEDNPGLALGNAVGSIICDTGLILGLAATLSPLPLRKSVVNRQGWIQVGAGFLLVLVCLPFASLPSVFSHGGNLPQVMGFVFLALLMVYITLTIGWSKGEAAAAGESSTGAGREIGTVTTLLKLIAGIGLVVISSKVLIPAVNEIALRLEVPQSIVAATLVAFGTSLPELVTALTAVRKGHGDLAVGNVIGADILNVLFVAGAAAAVTPEGLEASARFFTYFFPFMLCVLIIFRVGIYVSGERLGRPFGILLLVTYFAYLIFLPKG